MVDIDYSFKKAAGLQEFAASVVQLFEKDEDKGIKVQAGVVTPAEACPFVVITPQDSTTIEQLNDLLCELKQTYQTKAETDEQACRVLFLLDAVRIHPEMDHLPPCVIVAAGPMVLQELGRQLTLEAA